MNNMHGNEKKLQLAEYYGRVVSMLSFELLITINLKEEHNLKQKKRRILKKRV